MFVEMHVDVPWLIVFKNIYRGQGRSSIYQTTSNYVRSLFSIYAASARASRRESNLFRIGYEGEDPFWLISVVHEVSRPSRHANFRSTRGMIVGNWTGISR